MSHGVQIGKTESGEYIEFGGQRPLKKRFDAAKQRSQERQNVTELTHSEFFRQMLVVWELHESRMLQQGTQPEANECGHYSDNYQP